MGARALVFDLDGLILDTESTDFASWDHVYREHGHTLPRERWLGAIGSDGSSFDPLHHLRELLAHELDVASIQARRRSRRDALIAELGPLPGVAETLAGARRRGLAVGLASSSPRWWVEGHLERVGLREHFAVLRCSDDVEQVKPDPSLYVAAVAALGVAAHEAIALEDSPHGVTAAKAAGLFCIAVPGPMTRELDFSHADLVLESMAELVLEPLL